MGSPFKYFDSSPEVIRLAVMLYVRYPLSLRNVEDLLAERGIDIYHETVRLWWNRFGPLFAAEIRKRRLRLRQGCPEWRWHFDEVFVKINGQIHYLWRAVDHEGEVLEAVATKRREWPTKWHRFSECPIAPPPQYSRNVNRRPNMTPASWLPHRTIGLIIIVRPMVGPHA